MMICESYALGVFFASLFLSSSFGRGYTCDDDDDSMTTMKTTTKTHDERMVQVADARTMAVVVAVASGGC